MVSAPRLALRVCLAVLAVLLAMVALPVTTAPAQAAPSLPTVEPGVLTVGTEGTYAPFSYHVTGRAHGFDVDIITDVAKKLGLRVKFVERASTVCSRRWRPSLRRHRQSDLLRRARGEVRPVGPYVETAASSSPDPVTTRSGR